MYVVNSYHTNLFLILFTYFDLLLLTYLLQPQLLLLTNTYVAYIMYIVIYYTEQHII